MIYFKIESKHFGRLIESKTIGPIKLEMLKIGKENIHQKHTSKKIIGIINCES